MRRSPLLPLVLLAVPLQAEPLPPAGMELVVCTAAGPRRLRVDADGQPVDPDRRQPTSSCAHLWCEPRRPRGRRA